MVCDIFNLGCVLKLPEKSFRLQYDHKSIALLEKYTEKGFYAIYREFISGDETSDKDLINIISFSALKHHGADGVDDLYGLLLKNPDVNKDFLIDFKIHFNSLLPDFSKVQKDLKLINKNYKAKKSSSDFYNFEEGYALAKNILNWSDNEFWQATPRYLSFALISYAKYKQSQDEISEKKQTADGIHFLNSIKRLL